MAMLPGSFHTAVAQAYPTRPVRLVVPSPPGGLADTLARLMGEWLAGRLRQPFVIENKSGAGTISPPRRSRMRLPMATRS